MTNLKIIKYLTVNNPDRLANLLTDLYCIAWNCGAYVSSNEQGNLLEECEIGDFNVWLYQNASESGLYFDDELAKWSKRLEMSKPSYVSVVDMEDTKTKFYKEAVSSKYVKKIKVSSPFFAYLKTFLSSPQINQEAGLEDRIANWTGIPIEIDDSIKGHYEFVY